jgi:hypothetical protein
MHRGVDKIDFKNHAGTEYTKEKTFTCDIKKHTGLSRLPCVFGTSKFFCQTVLTLLPNSLRSRDFLCIHNQGVILGSEESFDKYLRTCHNFDWENHSYCGLQVTLARDSCLERSLLKSSNLLLCGGYTLFVPIFFFSLVVCVDLVRFLGLCDICLRVLLSARKRPGRRTSVLQSSRYCLNYPAVSLPIFMSNTK